MRLCAYLPAGRPAADSVAVAARNVLAVVDIPFANQDSLPQAEALGGPQAHPILAASGPGPDTALAEEPAGMPPQGQWQRLRVPRAAPRGVALAATRAVRVALCYS